MNVAVRELASVVADILERTYELGRAVGAGEADRSLNALVALQAETMVEALGTASRARSGPGGMPENDEFARGSRSAALLMLEIAAQKPSVLADVLQRSPLDGLYDGEAIIQTARESLERRGRL